MAAPGYRVLMAFGKNPELGYAAVADHTDVTAYVKSVTIRRGRNQDLDRTEAGVCTIELDNADGRFTPENTSGAHAPNLRPFAQVYVQWQDAALAYHGLFRGFVERWAPTWYNPRGGTCTAECVDAFRVLQLNPIATATGGANAFTLGTAILGNVNATVYQYVSQSIGARIAAVLLNCGNNFTSSIATTGFVVSADSVEDNALEYIKALAVLDAGLFYVDGDGVITFKSHITIDGMTERYVVQAEIGDAGGGQIGYLELSTSMDEQRVINRVTGANSAGTAITMVEDVDSQALYMRRATSLGTTDIVSVSDVAVRARKELSSRKDARLRVDSVAFQLLDTTIDAETLLGLDLSHRVEITRTPDQGAVWSRGYLVQGMDHSIEPGTWVMRMSVSGVPDPFVLGLAVLGADAL